ncbi:hypothetical protein DD237_000733 [Peronospora effusa]|uniref:Uncharacterized protein n=1 Tax=Peronospora effusa TaxID=542832 RepID=A0A3R7XL25_9STRA|nr:hypothetical protein DD237_000733 [Peronospora effusa]
MENGRADRLDLLPLGPEIILIRDNEMVDDEEEKNSFNMESVSWTEIADRLLILAKNHTLRKNQDVVATLLQNCNIPPSMDVQRSLQATCEELGQLLLFLRGHNRRQRACEGLVLVVCEVLSLVQTTPYTLSYGRRPWMKEEKTEVHYDCAMDIAYHLMDRWGICLAQCARSSDCRSFAIGSTMSRLERRIVKCSSDMKRLHNFMLQYEQEMKNATEEWAETMIKCRRDLEPQWINAKERDWKVYDDTFHRTKAVQMKFEENKNARNSLMHYAQEQELRSKFYRATLRLIRVATQQSSIYIEQEQQLQMASNETINVLGNEILEHMDTLCSALQDVMVPNLRYHGDVSGRTDITGDMTAVRTCEYVDQLDLIHFAKHFETFWLIHRSWFPQGVLAMLMRMKSCLNKMRPQGAFYAAQFPVFVSACKQVMLYYGIDRPIRGSQTFCKQKKKTP